MRWVLTGPESTAKSTLARELASALDYPLVVEAARDYLAHRSTYKPSDLMAIAQTQQARERAAGDNAVCDTDLQVITIWWQEKFGPVPHTLSRMYAEQDARFYLLCAPDIEWQPDRLRENPRDRERLMGIYERDLQRRGLPYAVVSGIGEQRLEFMFTEVKKVQTF